MANTAFSVLYGAVCAKLKDSGTNTVTRAKYEVNNACREILSEADWPFYRDNDNFKIGTGSKKYAISDSDFGQLLSVRVSDQKTLGDSSATIVITNPVGTTFTYTYNGTGTDPLLGSNYQEVGDIFTCTGFANGGNDVTNAVITAVGTDYISITNASGVVETKSGPVLKMICSADGINIRRTVRNSTALQPVLPVSEVKYSMATAAQIEFNAPVTSIQGIFYDYKMLYTLLSNDGDLSAISPSFDHVVIQLAYAKMLNVDDDTREVPAYAIYKDYLKKMLLAYFWSDEIEQCTQPGGTIGA
jgi:hypothetical protein